LAVPNDRRSPVKAEVHAKDYISVTLRPIFISFGAANDEPLETFLTCFSPAVPNQHPRLTFLGQRRREEAMPNVPLNTRLDIIIDRGKHVPTRITEGAGEKAENEGWMQNLQVSADLLMLCQLQYTQIGLKISPALIFV
jgi:hypothetical protein